MVYFLLGFVVVVTLSLVVKFREIDQRIDLLIDTINEMIDEQKG